MTWKVNLNCGKVLSALKWATEMVCVAIEHLKLTSPNGDVHTPDFKDLIWKQILNISFIILY